LSKVHGVTFQLHVHDFDLILFYNIISNVFLKINCYQRRTYHWGNRGDCLGRFLDLWSMPR